MDPASEEWLRPPTAPDGGPCVVDMRFAIFKVDAISAVSLSASIKIAIVWYWTDPRLAGWDADTPLPELLWGPTALCVTCCILFSHGFFFWAQYGADMMSINLTAKVMWETRGPLAAAVGLLERSICNTDCLFEGHEPVRTGSTLADTLCNTISCSSCERTHRRCSKARCISYYTECVH